MGLVHMLKHTLLKSNRFNVIFVCQLCDILNFHYEKVSKKKCHICVIVVLNKLTLTQPKDVSDSRCRHVQL